MAAQAPSTFTIGTLQYENQPPRYHKKLWLHEKHIELAAHLFTDPDAPVTEWVTRNNALNQPIRLHFFWHAPIGDLPSKDSIQIDLNLSLRSASTIHGLCKTFSIQDFDNEAQKTLRRLRNLTRQIITGQI